MDEDVDLNRLAEASPGFVGADLKSMVDQAHYLAVTETEAEDVVKVYDFSISGPCKLLIVFPNMS